jgi:hypothetical protein
MDGWMDGHNGGFKDCLQQLKMRTFFLHWDIMAVESRLKCEPDSQPQIKVYKKGF